MRYAYISLEMAQQRATRSDSMDAYAACVLAAITGVGGSLMLWALILAYGS
jgi:hypothetical protein